MSVEELNCKFNEWNPMKNDYKKNKFNRYVSDPGAELQAVQQALQNSKGNDAAKKNNENFPTLVFTHLPKEMTVRAIQNLCSKHGKVITVRDSFKNNYYFVELATVADMEAVFLALEHNSYGFQVVVAKNSTDSYCKSNKQQSRANVKKDSLLNTKSESAVDAHSLKRQGPNEMPNNEKFNDRNGRCFVSMTEKTKEFVDKKPSESSGTGNGSANKCCVCYHACDTICARCSQPYCSTKCQLCDWTQHRYICGKLKHLQKTLPPLNKRNEFKKKSSEISKERIEEVLKISDDDSKKGNEKKSYLQLPSCSTIFKTELEKPIAYEMELPSSSTSTAISVIRNLPTNVKQQQSPCDLITSSNVAKIPPSTIGERENIPRSGNTVTITEILKTNVVFVRSKTNEDNLSYFNTIGRLRTISKMLQPLKSMPQCGHVVIAKFEDQFKRALVLQSINPVRIFICFMDYGNFKHMRLDDLCEAPAEFVVQPRHAIPVQLKDVPQLRMTEEIRKFMYSNLQYINAEIRYKDDDFRQENNLFAVELINESTQQNLNHVIIKLLKSFTQPQNNNEIRSRDNCGVCVPEPSNTNKSQADTPTKLTATTNEICYRDQRAFVHSSRAVTTATTNEIAVTPSTTPATTNEIYYRNYLQQKVLPSGENVKFFVMDNSLINTGCISCTIKPYVIEIQKFQKELQVYAESIAKESYTPRVNELCVARYSLDGLWYRGLCLECVADGQPSIHFIDYGNIYKVPIQDIRRYSPQLTYPIYTADCGIDGKCNNQGYTNLPDIIEELDPPAEFFNFFFNDDLIEFIVEQSNLFALHIDTNKPANITKNEIEQFVGLLDEFDDKLVTKRKQLIPLGETIKCKNVTAFKEENFYIISLPKVIKEINVCVDFLKINNS